MGFERQIAFRYLRPRKGQGFVSVIAGFSLLGITLGVATLIIVMAVMNGFRQELFTRILGLNAHVAVYATQGNITDYQNLKTELEKLPAVKSAAPVIEGQVMVTYRGKSSGALLRGLAPEDVKSRPLLAGNIMDGDLNNFSGINAAMIGRALANRLGMNAGDYITVLSPQGQITAFGSIPRSKAFETAAIFSVGMYEYDNGFIYVPLEAAQNFYSLEGQAYGIEILLHNPMDLTAAREQIRNTVGPDMRVVDWQQTHQTFFSAIQVERNVMFIILTLIIVVAAFNIISGLIMLVKDKTSAIAILRTMGATRGSVMRIFFISGATIGILGTFLGFALGLAFVFNIESIRQALEHLTGTRLFSPEIYFLSQLPAKIDPVEVVSVVAMALGLSFLATLYPAWRASRLDPIQALRHE